MSKSEYRRQTEYRNQWRRARRVVMYSIKNTDCSGVEPVGVSSWVSQSVADRSIVAMEMWDHSAGAGPMSCLLLSGQATI